MNRASAAAVLISLAVTGGLVQSCGKSATAPTPSDRPYFGGLEVHGNTHLSAVGDRSQLRAVALYSDGSSADVTSVVAWTVPSGSVVSVSSEGLVEALALGITSVQAVYGLTGRARATLPVSVTPAGTFAVGGQIRYPPAGGISAVSVLEPVSMRSTVTDGDGLFMLAGLVGTELRLTRDGYEPVSTSVAPFSDHLDLLMQPIVQLQAGGSLTGTIATDDLSYVVMPGTACAGCRLVRVQSATSGRLDVKLTWFVAASRMFLWADGQEFKSDGALELVATFPVRAGETIIYVGAASTLRDVDYELKTVFVPS